MWEDPIVAEVHQVREQLAAQFNFDVKAIFADMRRRQTALGGRLVSQTSTSKPTCGPLASGHIAETETAATEPTS